MNALSCFVTGTDTEIGKTLVSCALLRAFAHTGLRAAAMKPVAAGAELIEGIWHNEDADQLDTAASVALPAGIRTPYLLEVAAAPHIVAAQEGVALDIAHIVACHEAACRQADVVVVEGVGGFAVPLDDISDTADLAVALDIPVVMVVGMRLGCINHALLTAQAIRSRGLVLAGWVANCIDPHMLYAAENIESLQRRLDHYYAAPLLGVTPYLDPINADAAARHLNLDPLLTTLRRAVSFTYEG